MEELQAFRGECFFKRKDYREKKERISESFRISGERQNTDRHCHRTEKSGKDDCAARCTKAADVAAGQDGEAAADTAPGYEQGKITYKSANTRIAKVSKKGVITGKKAGTVKITVRSGRKKAVVTVKVK